MTFYTTHTTNQRKIVRLVWQLILKPSKHKYTYLPTTGMSLIILKLSWFNNLDITVAKNERLDNYCIFRNATFSLGG